MTLLRPSVFCAVVGIFLAAPAFSQNFVNPTRITGQSQALGGAAFSSASVDFEVEDESGEVEFTTLGFEGAYGLTPTVAATVGFGLISNLEIEDIKDDGDGYQLLFGMNGTVYTNPQVEVVASGVFNYTQASIDSKTNDLDITNKELHVGAIGQFTANDFIKPYAGLFLVPFKDGEIEPSNGKNSDFERDDLFYIKGGANIFLNQFIVRPEISLIGETTFTLAGEMLF